MSTIIKLRTPIDQDGVKLEQIELRDIKTKDYVSLGPVLSLVVNKDGSSQVKEFPKVIIAYIVRLTGLTETEVEKLSLPDFMRLRDYVRDSLDFSSEPDSEI